MPHETLQVIWFVLWAVIWIAYFVFDSFTIGTGILFPFISKDRKDRNQLQDIVGPFWNGAEVWLLTAGGGTFAAFPIVYADMFSLLYVPFFLVLFCVIFRAASLEFMHKDDNPVWVAVCKWVFCGSSFLLAFVFGVLFSNLFKGLDILRTGEQGGFGVNSTVTLDAGPLGILDLFNLYAMMGGLLFVAVFTLCGAAWINFKSNEAVADRAYAIGKIVAIACAALLALYYVATGNMTPIFDNFNDTPILYVIPILSVVAGLSAVFMFLKRRSGLSFALLILTLVLFCTTGFSGMFPNMLPSIHDGHSLTLYNASSSQVTLQIMFIVAVIFVPIVLAYQIWVHFMFRAKVKKEDAKGY